MFVEFLRVYRRSIIIGTVFILSLLAAGFFVWRNKRTGPPPVAALLPLPPVTSSIGENTPSPSPLLAPPPPYRGAAVEALDADPGLLKQVSGDYYQKSLGELKDLGRELTQNPRQPSLWMKVASIKHFYNDDAGAADAYEYLNVIADSDPVAFYNLALIYGYNLKQPQKAIPKFQAAIKRFPQNAGFYVAFANFYREVLNDLPQAEKVLLEGEVKAPASAGLYAALGSLYKAMSNTAKAVNYYEKALGMSDLSSGEREALTAEIARLKAKTN